MATVTFPPNLTRYTGGVERTAVAARSYRDLVTELSARFPALEVEVISRHALAINGAVIPNPMLETFDDGADLVFLSWIQGG